MRNFVHKHAQRSGAGPHKTKTELTAQEMIEEQMWEDEMANIIADLKQQGVTEQEIIAALKEEDESNS